MNPFGDDIPRPQPVEDDGQTGFTLVLERYHSHDVERVVVPDGVTQILPGAFRGHAELKEIELPHTLESIGAEAFASCTSLREVRIPSAVFELGERAFAGCSSLVRVRLSNRLLRIEDSTFSRCMSLREVLGGDEVDVVGTDAFGGCGDLVELPLLTHVRTLGYGALAGCASFEDIVLPNTMDSIGTEAFRSCRKLSRIVLPLHVEQMGRNLFAGCFNLHEAEGAVALARAFPDAFPRAMTDKLGVVRPQDMGKLVTDYRARHEAEADALRNELDTCRREVRLLELERDALGMFERARKREIDAELAHRRIEGKRLAAQIDLLENPPREALAELLDGATDGSTEVSDPAVSVCD